MKEVIELKLDEEIVAEKCQDVITELLRNVIDTALSKKFGASWFEMYKTDYNNQAREKNTKRKAEGKSQIPEIPDKVKSVKGLDFQACIKLFVFMYDKYASVIIEEYNLTESADEIKSITSKLRDFRNKLSHKNDTQFGKLTKNDCELAITYMKSLASFFPNVYDSKTNETYKSEICNIILEHNEINNTQPYFFSDFKEFNGISDEKLVMACTESLIKTAYVVVGQKKKLIFYSCNRDNDIQKILLAVYGKNTHQSAYQNGYSQVFTPPKEYYDSINKNKKKKSKLFYIIPVIILIIVLALIISGITGAVKSSNEEAKEASAEQSQRADMVNDIINEASRQVSEHQADSYENVTESTTSSTTTTTTKSSSNSSTNQIPDEFKTKFEASKPNWEEDLSVGETNLHGYVNNVSTMWDNVRGYSEDTSVATVGDDLIVTAKAKGVVKVLYVGEFMGEDRTYIIEYTVR